MWIAECAAGRNLGHRVQSALSDRRCLFGFLGAGVSLGVAALYPDRLLAVVFASLAVLGFCFFGRDSEQPGRHFFAAGILFYATAFYWLTYPLQIFGGFPPAIAYALFALFVLISALQFAAVGWGYGKLRPSEASEEPWILLPLLWFFGEFFFPRVFPWGVANNFLAWRSFASLAGISGVYPLSFLIFVFMSYAVHIFVQTQVENRIRHHRLIQLVLGAAMVLTGGAYRYTKMEDEISVSPRGRIGLIQGNLHAKRAADVLLLSANLETYSDLSRQAQAKGASLIVWPESVMNIWTPANVLNQSLRQTKFDPYPNGGGRLLYGTMSFEKKSDAELDKLQRAGAIQSRDDTVDKYNSVVAFDDGRATGIYHKRALMPFGEYLPFASTFPSLRRLSPYTGDLTAGRIVEPIVFRGDPEKQIPELRAGVLICYEDLVPALSRDYVRTGSNLLINLTNDAWYGFSHAQEQHSMLAAWRAIETGRSLVRDTNTGYSAVIDPVGESIASIPLYREGFVVADVPLLVGKTVYSQIGDLLSWGIVVAGLLYLAIGRRALRRAGSHVAVSV